MALATAAAPSREDFCCVARDSFAHGNLQEGAVIKGTVVAIEKDLAVIDVGSKPKAACRCVSSTVRAARTTSRSATPSRCICERVENALGEAVLSRDKARREESWGKLERAFQNNEKVQGVIFNQVKGGFTVDLERRRGVFAALPGRHPADPRRHSPDERHAAVPDSEDGPAPRQYRGFTPHRAGRDRAEQRQELVQNLEEGQVIDGVVKNITTTAPSWTSAGIDGLLHVTDIAWRRVNHPSEVLNIGQQVKVKIVRSTMKPTAFRSA